MELNDLALGGGPATIDPAGIDGIVGRAAAFAAGTKFADLPSAVVWRMKNSILDVLACGAYGSKAPTVNPFLGYVLDQGAAPAAAIWTRPERTSAFHAALINATFVHATEMSETYIRAVVHPGNVIVPAAVAVAEREHASGAELLTATAMAYELLIRFGFSVGTPFMMKQGLHSFSVMGVFGSTVAVSRLLGFDKAQLANALGIAACHTPTPLIVAATEGATVKEIFEGYASALGVMAADLSRRGVGGVGQWAHHWYHAVPRQSDIRNLADRLGQTWMTAEPGLRIKTRPVMGMVQPTVGALIDLIGERQVNFRAIQSIRVETTKRAFIAGNDSPETVTAAKVSIPFMTAAVLVRQDAARKDPFLLHFIKPDLLADAEVRALAAKVTVALDPEMEFNFEEGPQMKYESRVRIAMASGEEIIAYKDLWPSTSAMTYDEVAAKFRGCVEGVLTEARAEQVVETVRHLEKLDDAAALTRLLAPT